jgi:hypothetical protein
VHKVHHQEYTSVTFVQMGAEVPKTAQKLNFYN